MATREGGGGTAVLVTAAGYVGVYYAMTLAAAVGALKNRVLLFFTWRAVAVVVGGEGDVPAWHGLQGEDGRSPRRLDDAMAARGCARLEALLSSCRALGARFYVCESGLAVCGLEGRPLRRELGVERSGFVSFLSDADRLGCRLVFA